MGLGHKWGICSGLSLRLLARVATKASPGDLQRVAEGACHSQEAVSLVIGDPRDSELGLLRNLSWDSENTQFQIRKRYMTSSFVYKQKIHNWIYQCLQRAQFCSQRSYQ